MHNKVQAKIFAVTCLVVAVLIIGVFVRSQLDEIRIKMLQNSRTMEETQQFEQIYKLLDKTLESFVYDYTYWDEMYDFAQKPKIEWAKVNIDEVLPKFNVQSSWVINRNGELIYSTNHFNDPLLLILPFDKKVINFISEKEKIHSFLFAD